MKRSLDNHKEIEKYYVSLARCENNNLTVYEEDLPSFKISEVIHYEPQHRGMIGYNAENTDLKPEAKFNH